LPEFYKFEDWLLARGKIGDRFVLSSGFLVFICFIMFLFLQKPLLFNFCLKFMRYSIKSPIDNLDI